MTKVIISTHLPEEKLPEFTEAFNKAKLGTFWKVQVEEQSSEPLLAALLVAKVNIPMPEEKDIQILLDMETMEELDLNNLTIIYYQEVDTIEITYK